MILIFWGGGIARQPNWGAVVRLVWRGLSKSRGRGFESSARHYCPSARQFYPHCCSLPMYTSSTTHPLPPLSGNSTPSTHSDLFIAFSLFVTSKTILVSLFIKDNVTELHGPPDCPLYSHFLLISILVTPIVTKYISISKFATSDYSSCFSFFSLQLSLLRIILFYIFTEGFFFPSYFFFFFRLCTSRRSTPTWCSLCFSSEV